MGAPESKEAAQRVVAQRLNARYEGVSEEIRALRPARYLDKQDIQELVRRLEAVRDGIESDIQLIVQQCELATQA